MGPYESQCTRSKVCFECFDSVDLEGLRWRLPLHISHVSQKSSSTHSFIYTTAIIGIVFCIVVTPKCPKRAHHRLLIFFILAVSNTSTYCLLGVAFRKASKSPLSWLWTPVNTFGYIRLCPAIHILRESLEASKLFLKKCTVKKLTEMGLQVKFGTKRKSLRTISFLFLCTMVIARTLPCPKIGNNEPSPMETVRFDLFLRRQSISMTSLRMWVDAPDSMNHFSLQALNEPLTVATNVTKDQSDPPSLLSSTFSPF